MNANVDSSTSIFEKPRASSNPAKERVVSLDAYRGLVMLLMMGEVLEFSHVARALPGNSFWNFLAHHQSHVPWIGCSLHDLIQPSFSFLVGAALPFSLARRSAQGESNLHRTLHAFWRSLVLILLGVLLRSIGAKQTYWTFEDTLTQIGLGYGFLYLIANRSVSTQWASFFAILFGYWLAFALYPLPGPDFDWSKAGTTLQAPTQLPGFAGHWSLNTNLAWAFDTWFLNLFPRQSVFTRNSGGYSTLSFIPTLATMILGLLAGDVLRKGWAPQHKVRWFVIAGAIGLTSGWLLGATGICPVVKRIWTPSWVLFSGGCCFLMLAVFYQLIDVWRKKSWAFFLVVIGMNSIAAYLIAHLFTNFIGDALITHLGGRFFTIGGEAYQPFLQGAAILLIEWLILWWMYKRKIFLRV